MLNGLMRLENCHFGKIFLTFIFFLVLSAHFSSLQAMEADERDSYTFQVQIKSPVKCSINLFVSSTTRVTHLRKELPTLIQRFINYITQNQGINSGKIEWESELTLNKNLMLEMTEEGIFYRNPDAETIYPLTVFTAYRTLRDFSSPSATCKRVWRDSMGTFHPPEALTILCDFYRTAVPQGNETTGPLQEEASSESSE